MRATGSRPCASAAGRASRRCSSGRERGMTYAFLSGLRIVESSAFIAAPLAGLTLAQFGADVIRVDMIGGGIDYGRMPRMPRPHRRGRSLYWTALNKGKRSIAIDMRRPEGRELLQALATAPGPR